MAIQHLGSALGPTVYASIFLYNRGSILYGRRLYNRCYVGWTMPGGPCLEGETMEETLRRTVLEQTGIIAFHIRKFLGIVDAPTVGDKLYIYTGATSQEPAPKKDNGFSEWDWFEDKRSVPRFLNREALKVFHQSLTG